MSYIEPIDWIPVSEKSPDLSSKAPWERMDVLFVSNGAVYKGTVMHAENGRVYWDSDDPDVSIEFDSITYYAELPKGPQL